MWSLIWYVDFQKLDPCSVDTLSLLATSPTIAPCPRAGRAARLYIRPTGPRIRPTQAIRYDDSGLVLVLAGSG